MTQDSSPAAPGASRRDGAWAVVLAAAIFFLYIKTSSPTLLACGDSPELVTAAWTLGVAHAPGYPLYALAGRLAGSIFPGAPAHRLELCMGVFASLAAALIYLLLARLCRSRLAAAAGALTLAVSYHFRLFAHVPEIGALNVFFAALLCWLVQRHAEDPAGTWTELGAFVFGLAFCHHQTIVFLLPGLVYAAIAARRRAGIPFSWSWLVRLCAFCWLGLTPYLYLLIRGRAMPFLNTGTVTNFSRLVDHVLRRETGTLSLTPQYTQFDWDRSLGLLAFYGGSWVKSFSWIGVALGLLGLRALKTRSRELFWFVLSGVLLAGPFFFIYARMPADSVSLVALLERFLPLSFTLCAVPIGLGFEDLADRAGPRARTAALAAGLLLPAGLLWRDWKPLDFTGFKLCEMYGRDLFRSLPENSLAVMDGDTSLFTLWYLQRAQGLRPDVAVVNASLTEPYLETLRRDFPGLPLPASAGPGATRELFALNMARGPVYETGIPGTKLPEFGLWNNPFTPQPRGLALQIVTRFDPKADDEALWDSFEFRKDEDPGPDAPAFERDIVYLYTLARYNKAAYLYLNSAPQAAYKALQQTLALDPGFAPALALMDRLQPH